MNNKEIAEQLFETKFIKALYNTSLERSFINKIIAEELLREAGEPEPVPIDSILSDLNKALADIKKEGDDPVENMIELFMLAAKIEAVYLPKFGALKNKGVKGFDDRTLEKLLSFSSVVKGLASSLTPGLGFGAFLDVYEKGEELNKEDIATQLNKINAEKLDQIYKKLQPTAVKAFNDVIEDIDQDEKTQDITDRSTAVTEMRRIVSRAKGSIERLESFVEQVKQKLGKEFSKYGKLNAFIKNQIEPIKQRTRRFLEKFEQRKDEIEQELANLRTVKEEKAATPELIQELVNEWSGIQKEISEVFDKLRDKGLYEKGEVDDAGETALPKVTLESESLAEMLAHAFAYENDENAEKIYEVLQSEGTGFLSAYRAGKKKAFNEEDQKDEGPSQEQKEKFVSSKKIFAKFEPEIALAFAARHINLDKSKSNQSLENELENEENFKDVELNFKTSDLAKDYNSINILKQFLKNNRRLEGIQYDIERKLRQGEWNPGVYKSLLKIDASVFDINKYGKSLFPFLKKIYMIDDYDPKTNALDRAKESLKMKAIDRIEKYQVEIGAFKDEPTDFSKYEVFNYNTFCMVVLQALVKRKPKINENKVSSEKQIEILLKNPKLFKEYEEINKLTNGRIEKYLLKKYPYVIGPIIKSKKDKEEKEKTQLADLNKKSGEQFNSSELTQIDIDIERAQQKIRRELKQKGFFEKLRKEQAKVLQKQFDDYLLRDADQKFNDAEELSKNIRKRLDRVVRFIEDKVQSVNDKERLENWLEDNPFLPSDSDSEVTKSGKKQQKDRAKKARDSMDYHPSNPDRLAESIENLIYLMLNEYKQKMEP